MKPTFSKSGYDITPLAPEKVAELAAKLDPEAYRITQKAGTEPPFCGNLLDNHKDGIYVCVVCGLPLFSSEHKFNSGTGWPSFFRELRPGPRESPRGLEPRHGPHRDRLRALRGAPRTRLRRRPQAHRGAPLPQLGLAPLHREGHTAAGRRASPSRPRWPTSPAAASGGSSTTSSRDRGSSTRRAATCRGTSTTPPTSRSARARPATPRRSRSSTTRRASRFRRLLEAFFVMHDPTELDRQGPDVGSQYRSGIWTVDAEQEQRGEGLHPGAAGIGQARQPDDRHPGRAGQDVLARRGLPPGLRRHHRPRLPRRQSLVDGVVRGQASGFRGQGSARQGEGRDGRISVSAALCAGTLGALQVFSWSGTREGRPSR